MEEIFETLENLKSELEIALESTKIEAIKKNTLDKILNFVSQSMDIISYFDKNKVEDWKLNDKHRFLHFVPFLKNILLNLNNYINNIAPSLRHFYTEEIAGEIVQLNKEIEKFQQELNPDFEQISLKEKVKLEQEYNRLKILLGERDELIKKDNTLKSFDLDEIRQQISELTEQTIALESQIEPLKAEKARLQKSLENFNIFNQQLETLKSTHQQSSALLLVKIEESVKYIQEKHIVWQENKEEYLKKRELELKNLSATESEIKKYLLELSSYRDSVIRNKKIIEKHFNSNKKIGNSLPVLKESINLKSEKIELELKAFDDEIRQFLEINQKIADEISIKPITFDY